MKNLLIAFGLLFSPHAASQAQTVGQHAQAAPSLDPEPNPAREPLFPAQLAHTAPGPAFAQLADLDGDGFLDAVTANSNAGAADTVSVLLGGGDGTLRPGQDYVVGASPDSLAIADFDQDGTLDLATAPDTVGVSIVFGLGDGTFGPAQSFPSGGVDPGPILTAELNADGLPDLVVVHTGSADVSVFFGLGAGSFTAPQVHLVGLDPVAVAVADLNADSLPDLVVVNAESDDVSILLGSGIGTFSSAQTLTGLLGPNSLAIADLDLDGNLDLAIAGTLGVRLLFGAGDGTFPVFTQVLSPLYQPSSLALSDLDQDGLLDLVVGTLFRGETLILLAQGSGGNFPAITHTYLVPSAGGMAAGDLDRDGVPDLVLPATNDAVVALAGRGDGSLAVPLHLPQVPTEHSLEVVGIDDLNTDGLPDLVTWAGDRGVDRIKVWLGTAAGAWAAGPDTLLPATPSGLTMALGDLDQDGLADLAIPNLLGGGLLLYAGQGDGSFAPAGTPLVGGLTFAAATGDFNGDSVTDLAVTSDPGGLGILLGVGGGAFVLHGTFPAANGASMRELVVQDFDLDGVQDIATGWIQAGEVSVFLGLGDGSFQAPVGYAASDPVDLASGDVNGDGVPDLVVTDPTGPPFLMAGFQVLLGVGDGSFGPSLFTPTLDSPGGLALGDFDGDARLDVLVPQDESVDLYLGSGDGTFPSSRRYFVGPAVQNLAAGQLDDNGKLDAVVAAKGSGATNFTINHNRLFVLLHKP